MLFFLDLMSIGRKWKEIISVTDRITYSFHDDSKRERNAKSRYNVAARIRWRPFEPPKEQLVCLPPSNTCREPGK
ncbi:hypothetical protein OIU77_014641 [Salix suchowensis]|uniref:Uncharacterized protein n=1 Tax=Salix suchowensis TaxID=1278906 RepID=A0ABQ8ZYL1_9ROSI|nr:hypothetical protein OIU77_014641 [Salix suchowensis]